MKNVFVVYSIEEDYRKSTSDTNIEGVYDTEEKALEYIKDCLYSHVVYNPDSSEFRVFLNGANERQFFVKEMPIE